MIVEKQGDNECALSTIAALAGRPLAEVREVGREESARAGKPFYKHAVLNAVAARMGVAHVAIFGLGVLSTTGYSARVLGSRTRKLPAKGRGMVRVQPVRRTRTGSWVGRGHVCPWKNGFLYDPNTPERPYTLAEFRRALKPGWRLDYITIEEVR